MNSPDLFTFEVKPRTTEQGGGWQLILLDGDGVEIGGGVFPAGDDGYCDAYDVGSQWIGENNV